MASRIPPQEGATGAFLRALLASLGIRLREPKGPPKPPGRLTRSIQKVFFRTTHDREMYFRLLLFSAPHARYFVLAITCMCLTGLFDVGPYGLLQPILDDIFTEKKAEMLPVVSALMVALFALKGVFNYLQKYLIRTIGQLVIRDVRQTSFEHVLRLPHQYLHGQLSGDLIARINSDVQIIDKGVSTVISDLFKEGFTIVACVALIIHLDWRFAVIALVSIPLLVAPIGFIAQSLRRSSKISQEKIGDLMAISQEAIQGVSVVKAFCGEDHEAAVFAKENEVYHKHAVKAIRAASYSTPIIEFIGATLGAGVIFVGGYYVISGAITGGTLITCLGLLFKMYMPFKQLGNINHAIQQAVVAAERIFQVLDTPVLIEDAPDAVELAPLTATIEFRDVWYSYTEEPVLRGLSTTIRKGEIVALVGPSGGGKTTLIHLIPRFYDLTRGAILIDGLDIRQATLRSLRGQIGIVTQDVILFHESIASNIAYGADEIDLDRVQEAARMAYADEFIRELPNGYETVLGERGLTLSGGQRQRLSIARALYHDPAILLLDEATSALDTESEIIVQKAIQNLVVNRTTLVVAHRLSTVRNVHRILVLQEGNIVEEGTHEELLRNGVLYRKLHDLQFQEE